MTSKDKPSKMETILAHGGRPQEGPVNRPVQRGSTVAFRSLAAFKAEVGNSDLREATRYGRVGNPNSHDFESVMSDLEGGYGAVTASSGLAIIACTLMAFATPGAHFLVTDSVYGPVRRFCDKRLRHLGVEIEYYDPLAGGFIEKLFRDNTKVVYMESPGSKTFEIQDVPAIARAAKKRGIVSMADNTWATPLFFKPLSHGADISLHAATKYIGGHSDIFLGVAICGDEDTYKTLKTCAIDFGQCASPDDLYLALRGLRTLEPRLRRHQENTGAVVAWLQKRAEVERIIYPALPDCPGHELWKRDFKGAAGLFSMILKTSSKDDVRRFIDGLEYFPLGYSWGGYESLLVPLELDGERTVSPFRSAGLGLRLHIGLENPDDLIADLEAGFKRTAP
jgi:cysteine-S-conjugate beta-lyase